MIQCKYAVMQIFNSQAGRGRVTGGAQTCEKSVGPVITAVNGSDFFFRREKGKKNHPLEPIYQLVLYFFVCLFDNAKSIFRPSLSWTPS